MDGVKNYSTSVKKRGDDITFLRRIVKGPADGSYGIEVAKLAGVPDAVVNNAKKILKTLESQQSVSLSESVSQDSASFESEEEQLSFDFGTKDKILDELKSLDVNTLTPIEALTKLYALHSEASNL